MFVNGFQSDIKLSASTWDSFLYFRNEDTLAKYLSERYERQGVKEIRKAVYEATPKIIFNIIHAERYFHAGEKADLLIQPVLFYYGMMSLAKVLINSMDATYPTTTTVLKHGLSTRKLKRSDYKFTDDEVKVQSGGLFVSFHQCLTGETIPSLIRMRLGDLLHSLPEMSGVLELCLESPPRCAIIHACGEDEWLLSRKLLQTSGRTRNEFLHMLNEATESLDGNDEPGSDIQAPFSYVGPSDPEGMLHIRCKEQWWLNSKFVRTDNDHQQLWFSLPVNGIHVPELSAYFMVMFALSMLCRYETERWGEMMLTYATSDLYIIHQFLSSAIRKFPERVLHFLFDRQTP